jgi:ATP/maltotriose-dependent transcriptional regulator MalT
MSLLPSGTADWFRAVGDAGTALGRSGRHGEIEGWIAAVADVVPTADALSAWAIAFARMAVHLYHFHHTAEADRVLGAVTAGLRGRDPGPLAEARIAGARASKAAMAFDLAGVEEHTRASLRAYECLGDLRNVCTQASVLGIAAERAGDFEAAAHWQQQALEIAQRLRLAMGQGMCLSSLARIHFATGERARGIAEARQAIEWLGRTEQRRLLAVARAGLSWMHFATGDLDAAWAVAERAYDLANFAWVACQHSLALRARICLRRGDVPGAQALLEQVVDGGQEDRAIFDGETLVELARIEARLADGNAEGARAVAAAAWERLRTAAARLRDPARRESYLTRVPLNAELLAMCDRLGVARDGR